MADSWKPLTNSEKQKYDVINKKNLEFLMNRYNKVNRWVIADMIRRSAYRYPDKPALIFKDRTLTYSQLEEDCNRVANALEDLGVKKYDRVAILAHNTMDHVLTWIGCAKIGAVYLAINYLLRGKDIAYCINHSESTVFIVEDSLFELVKDVLDDMPTVKTWIWSKQGAGRMQEDSRFLDFESWYQRYPATEPDTILHIEEPCQMTYTSGTESLPKGVIISNQALMAQYMGCIVDGQYDETDINVNALPIYHCAQRDVFMNPIFWVGGTNVLIMPDIGQILKSLADYKATMFFAPPTVWIGMLRHPDLKKYDLSHLKKCYYGASIMPVEILKEIMEKFPGTGIWNYYGQTELAPYHTVLKAKDALAKLGSAGMGGLNMETRLEDDEYNPITQPRRARRDLRQGRPRAHHVLQGPREDRGGHEGRLVPLGRHRGHGRGPLHHGGRPQEGHDQDGRRKRPHARGGGGHLPGSPRPGGGRRRPARPEVGREGDGRHRDQGGPEDHRGGGLRPLPQGTGGLQVPQEGHLRGRPAEDAHGQDPQAGTAADVQQVGNKA